MNSIKGFAAICDSDLNITDVIRDDFNFLVPKMVDITFLKIVEKDSIDKAFQFFREIKAHNAAFNWELNLIFPDEIDTCYITGVSDGLKIFIIATKELQDINAFFSQYQTIFNEQTNLLKKSLDDPEVSDISTNIYDEFSKINNELTDLHRDITKKNVLLSNQQKHLELINRILRHDLANFFVVIGSALRLYKRAQDPRFLDEISTKITKGIELIGDMKQLESVFGERHHLQPVNLLETVKSIAENYPELHISIDLPSIEVTADQGLDVIFDNMIRNSIRHGNSKEIKFSGTTLENKFILEIADDGSGIPDSVKDRIFEENFKYGESGNTGLGLYIVYRMMQNYRGSVKVEDNKPQGTVFKLEFLINFRK